MRRQSNAETSTEVNEENSSRKKGNNSGGAYSTSEDAQLCHSWLKVSTDPEVGTDQNSDELWRRIKEDYDSERSKFPGFKDRSGLKGRWGLINRCVCKFVGHYAQAKLLDASGSDSFDVVCDRPLKIHTKAQ